MFQACPLAARSVVFACATLACLATGCKMMAQPQNAEGVRLYQQGQYQQAINRFHSAIAADDRNPDGFYNLASTYHRLWKVNGRNEDAEQAESYYQQCLARDSNHRECRRGFAVLLTENNRSDEAFRMLERWSNENPVSAEPKVELARLSQEAGNKDAARNYLHAAIEADPYNAQAWAASGRLYEDAGNTNQALANYERSLQKDSFQPELVARVNSLRAAGATGPIVTPPGGTRLVTSPAPGSRIATNPTATLR